MLNKIMANLNGHGTEAASLEAALAQLGRDRDAAGVDLADLNEQRHRALLDDATDTVLDKLERAIDRKTVLIEKLNIAEPPLRERIAAAQREARQRLWRSHLDAYGPAAQAFLKAARECEAAHQALMSMVEDAQREFPQEAQLHMPRPGTLQNGTRYGSALIATDLLDLFEAAIEPAVATRRKAAAPSPAARPVPAVRTPAALPEYFAKRVADDHSELAAGECRVTVLASGYSPSDDRPQARAGQILKLPISLAENAARRGAIEITERSPK